MMQEFSEKYHTQNCRSGRRRVRSYTLQQAITPKTCGLQNTALLSSEQQYSSDAGRVIFVVCGLLFVGTGIFSILF